MMGVSGAGLGSALAPAPLGPLPPQGFVAPIMQRVCDECYVRAQADVSE
jgi:hypothetical protein